MRTILFAVLMIPFAVMAQTKGFANMTGGAVALTTTSAQSAVIALDGRSTVEVDVTCSADCFVAAGDDPTAVVPAGGESGKAGYFLVGLQTYRIYVPAGAKIAGILSSGTGTLYYHVVR